MPTMVLPKSAWKKTTKWKATSQQQSYPDPDTHEVGGHTIASPTTPAEANAAHLRPGHESPLLPREYQHQCSHTPIYTWCPLEYFGTGLGEGDFVRLCFQAVDIDQCAHQVLRYCRIVNAQESDTLRCSELACCLSVDSLCVACVSVG